MGSPRSSSPAAAILALAVAAPPACGAGSAHDEDSLGGGDGGEYRVDSVVVPEIEIDAHSEIPSRCFSHRLNNDEPLFVSTVTLQAGPAWHHSNWFFVPESFMAGPDGLWECAERDFDTLSTGLAGGVLFAQSVQVREESQAFPEGAVIEIPPHSQLVAQLHLLNASDQSVSTSLQLDIEAVGEADAETFLQPMAFGYFPLALPPRQGSSFVGECDFEDAIGAPADFSIYYAIPHFHELGVGARMEVVGGPRDGEAILAMDSTVGETWGRSYSPAFDLSGATGLRFSCDYVNPRDEVVGFGVGDQEMCAFGAYVDSPFRIAAIVQDDDEVVADDGAMEVHSGPCRVAAFL